MKSLIFILLISGVVFAANEYKQPNKAIFYNTVTLPQLNTSGIVTNNSNGTLSTVAKVPIANGGTNTGNSLANNRVIVSSGGTLGELSSSGTSGQFLVSAGSSSLPSWQTLSVGTIDSQSSVANGLQASGVTIYAQSASSSFPGLVTANSQTFGGQKSFNNGLLVGSIADLGGGLSISMGNNLDLTLQTFANGNMKFAASLGLALNEIATPSSPPASYDSLYFKSDNLLYSKSAAGTETAINPNPLPINRGGTNTKNALGNNKVIVSTGGTIGELSSAGSSGQVLTSNGSGTLPTWQTNSGSTPIVLAVGLDQNFTPSGANAPIKYDTVLVDTNNGYNTATGQYTFPESGNYQISVQAYNSAVPNILVDISGTQVAYIVSDTVGAEVSSGSIIVVASGGSTVQIDSSTATQYLGNHPYVNYLSISKVH